MKIRTAIAADLPSIDGIYNEAIEDGFKTAHIAPMSVKERKDWFRKFNDQYPLYVYEVDNEVLGWLSVSPYRKGRKALLETAEVSFYVAREARGQGVGSALLKHAINEAGRLNFHVYFAILIETNKASISLLKKHGFDKWGYLPEVINIEGERRGQFYYGKVL
ncbi:GNAT family N-acetyltransferase [Rhodohalobacter barkolensis]|uniref:N-acetyltransferase n=1 Tax=Rhodohalobacter barkolensis TaxID=2053187 RepID=A0A2N0VKY8_9BACT|nr:GNAT family N-acetyltransferase [Rhodohalobacter barkolensis]PKD44867.1 N-acetyltransferase [Rhodohalobacter barkolensis]